MRISGKPYALIRNIVHFRKMPKMQSGADAGFWLFVESANENRTFEIMNLHRHTEIQTNKKLLVMVLEEH